MSEQELDENPRILICDNVSRALIDGLENEGLRYDYRPGIKRKDLLEAIGNYGIVVVRSRTKLDSEIISRAERLKIIARAGIGVDNIDLGKADQMGIEVLTTKSAPTQSVVELNLGLAINLARKIVELNLALRNGDFRKEKGDEISGSVCGIIGFGRIGYETARILHGLGGTILGYDVMQNDDLMKNVEGSYTDLSDLVSRSDFIFICVALNDSSKGIINADILSRTKKGAIMINTSRAEAVEPEALANALRNGNIGGYAADVLWHEPPKEEWEKELIGMENVVVTPHIGAQTHEAQNRVALATLENIKKAVRGEPQ